MSHSADPLIYIKSRLTQVITSTSFKPVGRTDFAPVTKHLTLSFAVSATNSQPAGAAANNTTATTAGDKTKQADARKPGTNPQKEIFHKEIQVTAFQLPRARSNLSANCFI